MKKILYAALLSVAVATPAFAAKLYLKDGGVIDALRVWRSGDKVYVLATRHTETSFEQYEVDMKRTFGKQHKSAKKLKKSAKKAVSAASDKTAETEVPVESK